MEIIKVFIDWFLLVLPIVLIMTILICAILASVVVYTGDKSYFKKKFDRIGRD